MKNKNTEIILALSILLLATLACNSVLPQTEPAASPAPTLDLPQPTFVSPTQSQQELPLTEADVPRVTVEDAKLAFDNGEAIIVDVRSAEFYAESHIAGAVSIPLGEFEINIANVPLDKNAWIITYCT